MESNEKLPAEKRPDEIPWDHPLLRFTVASQIKSPWCLPYPCYKRKKELTTSRDYSTLSQLCFLGRWVAMQLFDGNNHHRDTVGTPIHKIPAWETGLPERWDILVDLFSGKVVPLMDYSRQWNLRQPWGASQMRKCNKPWAVKALQRWLRVLFLVTYYVICSRVVKLSEVLSVSPGSSKGAVSQQCWVLLKSLLKICTVYILKIPEFYCCHHGTVCLPRFFPFQGSPLPALPSNLMIHCVSDDVQWLACRGTWLVWLMCYTKCTKSQIQETC